MAGYSSSAEHVLAQLERLDAALAAQVERVRATARGDDLSAYYVSDAEVDTLLAGAPGGPTATPPGPEPDGRLADTLVPLRFPMLTAAFDLDPADVDTVLICLAPEIDRRYERLFGYLNDDVTRRLPTVGLLLDLTCLDPLTRLEARSGFSPSAPLVVEGLVALVDDRTAGSVSLLDRGVRLEPRIARFLLGEGPATPEIDRRWAGVARIEDPGGGGENPAAARLADAAASGAVVLCPATDPEFVLEAAASFAADQGRPLVHLPGDRLGELPDADLRELLLELGREARLTGSVLLVSGLETLADRPARLDLVGGWASSRMCPVVVSGTSQVLEQALPEGVTVTLPSDSVAERRRARRRLRTLARLVPPRYDWADLVLPEARATRLRELADVAKFRSTVLDDWGFGVAVAAGPGINVLFAGPSGTGKTMAAQVIARELGRDLFTVDLSSMVSKYIGETEKNLSAIFDAAGDGGCVLFFDEADALFGKRTTVKDAHDRHANVQTSYLLQKLEEHAGVVVMATNLRKNMDDAFVRRLHAVVEFPLPQPAERLRIWRQIWPAAAPLSGDVDLGMLADRIDLAGGHLRNIAMSAAYLAAADGGVITMAHLGRATDREYQQLGKVSVPGGGFGRPHP